MTAAAWLGLLVSYWTLAFAPLGLALVLRQTRIAELLQFAHSCAALPGRSLRCAISPRELWAELCTGEHQLGVRRG